MPTWECKECSDTCKDGIEMPTNVLGKLFFTVQRTSKPGEVTTKYE